MAYVASGGADCYFEFGIHAWDIGKMQSVLLPFHLIKCFWTAAGALIVKEAGGVCLDSEGMKDKTIDFFVDFIYNLILGGPLDILSRRMICTSSQELANQIIPLLTHMKLDRD